MQNKALHGCIQYIRERTSWIEEARTFDIAMGIDSKLPSIDYSTLDAVIDWIRTYDNVYTAEADQEDYTEEDIEGESDNLALQEPDIFL